MLSCARCLAHILGQRILIVNDRPEPPPVDWKKITAEFQRVEKTQYYDLGEKGNWKNQQPWYARFDKKSTKRGLTKRAR